MKKEWTLRQEMIIRFSLAALVPVLIFAIVTQRNMERSQQQYEDERIQSTLQTADQGLDMVLDKYATMLYDLCTDDEILTIVSRINDDENTLDVNSSTLRHELSHICNRNTGIEGITISLAGGETIFYDRLSSSSTNSPWANQVIIPKVKSGEVYRGLVKPVSVNGEEIYLFQIARNLVDYRNIHEILGTVVLSINEKQIQNALDVGEESPVYLMSGSIIISSPNKADIGKIGSTVMNQKENRYTDVINNTSGFVIRNEWPLDSYHSLVKEQWGLLAVIAVLSSAAAVLLTYSFTRPYLKVVDSYVEAMSRVQEGDLTARATADFQIPLEMRRIGHGFNEMVVHIEELIEQVKQVSMEQRTAELSALEAQIDPHFLYNTLDVINWKAIENEQYEISGMLGALADIFRYTVKNAGGTAALKEGIEWLENYFLLESAKLKNPPELEIHVPEELMEIQMHKLLIQPFVENAMKYAFAEKDGKCVLSISAGLVDGQLHIVTEDNGSGMDEELLEKLNDENVDMGEHMGIANVRKRLKLYYGEDAQVYFESILGSYTRVHLFIPIKEEIS